MTAGAVETRASVLRDTAQPTRLETLRLDAPGPGEVSVALRACGVCHTDHSIARGSLTHQPLPAVLGHEGAGVVEEIGPGVTNVAVGQRVAMAPLAPCGGCRTCLTGHGAYCEREEARGWGVLPGGRTPLRDARGEPVAVGLNAGFFSERAVVPASAVAPVPDTMPFEVAALLGCAVVTGYGAVVNTARVAAATSVLVLGLGGVGLSAVMAARLRGAHPIVAVDPDPDKRRLALEIGADDALHPDELSPPGPGFETIVEASGAPGAIERCLGLLRRRGTCVFVGAPPASWALTVPMMDLVATGKRLVGCLTGEVRPAVDLADLARLHAAGRLPLERLVTRTRPPDELEHAFADLEQGRGIRSVIVWPDARF